MRHESALSDAEEMELDRSLADIQRYPLQLDSEQWQQLRDLAKRGDRRGQLVLLRSTVGGRSAPMDADTPRFGHSPAPAIVQELLDRLQAAEQRAAVAEERLRHLEEDV